jgi:hypothetical protein
MNYFFKLGIFLFSLLCLLYIGLIFINLKFYKYQSYHDLCVIFPRHSSYNNTYLNYYNFYLNNKKDFLVDNVNCNNRPFL